jgi:hypothetical protein
VCFVGSLFCFFSFLFFPFFNFFSLFLILILSFFLSLSFSLSLSPSFSLSLFIPFSSSFLVRLVLRVLSLSLLHLFLGLFYAGIASPLHHWRSVSSVSPSAATRHVWFSVTVFLFSTKQPYISREYRCRIPMTHNKQTMVFCRSSSSFVCSHPLVPSTRVDERTHAFDRSTERNLRLSFTSSSSTGASVSLKDAPPAVHTPSPASTVAITQEVL